MYCCFPLKFSNPLWSNQPSLQQWKCKDWVITLDKSSFKVIWILWPSAWDDDDDVIFCSKCGSLTCSGAFMWSRYYRAVFDKFDSWGAKQIFFMLWWFTAHESRDVLTNLTLSWLPSIFWTTTRLKKKDATVYKLIKQV